jgi:hypothetical protein
MVKPTLKRLTMLLALYAIASLVHFIHNAEMLADYPNLPASWTRAGVYFAWLGMTTIGAIGLLLATRGFVVLGLLTIAVYATCGLDSLGHYILAPFSAHTVMMNGTIVAEVGTAALVLVYAMWMIAMHLYHRTSGAGQITT